MINLSNIFLDNTCLPFADNTSPSPKNDSQYQIHVGNMHIGVMNGRHLFMRITDGARVVCDFHGIANVENGRKRLFVAVEPGEYDYFTHLKPDEFIQVWEGGADLLGAKLQKIVLAADEINANPPDYRLISVNCNSVLKTFMILADIDMNSDLNGWVPGFGRKFMDVIDRVTDKVSENVTCPLAFIDKFEQVVAVSRHEFRQNNLVSRIEGFTHQIG